jgi:hypothetical protein
MEIRELKKAELDFAVIPCVDPDFRKTLQFPLPSGERVRVRGRTNNKSDNGN